jgi:hypothetical protein
MCTFTSGIAAGCCRFAQVAGARFQGQTGCGRRIKLKYTVSYSEKESIQMPDGNYKSVEIGLHKEFDDAATPFEAGYELVSNHVKEKMKAAVSEPTKADASASKKQIGFAEEPDPRKLTAPKHDTSVSTEPSEEEIFTGDEPVEEIPEFDPEVLMQWSWKGKKKNDGTYSKGSTSYGWDFANNFPESVILVLEKGPQTVDQYIFGLDESRKFVQARKKKESK